MYSVHLHYFTFKCMTQTISGTTDGDDNDVVVVGGGVDDDDDGDSIHQ